jgi:hypothetical protein
MLGVEAPAAAPPAAAAAVAPRHRPATAPFIMPDGRPLSRFLHDNDLLRERGRAGAGARRRRHAARGAGAAASAGWPAGGGGAAAPRAAAAAPPPTEAELAELAALARVGARRRRRYLNDRLLRDLAGPLTADHVEGLFKPVPFGAQPIVSAFQRVADDPEAAALWELFRSVDADREARVLARWEGHVAELRAEALAARGGARRGEGAAGGAGRAALAAWAAVAPRARAALRRAPRAMLEGIEAPVADFAAAADDSAAEAELALDLPGAFERLLAHALAEFHALSSFSRAAPGGKQFVARRRRGAAAASAGGILCSDVLWAFEAAQRGGSAAAAALRDAADAHLAAVAAA